MTLVISALITSVIASINWGIARVLGSQQSASTVALIGLVGSQLGQTLFAAKGSVNVIATGLGSLALLLAIVETPGLSQFFGCRPLGPLGLLHAAGSVAVSMVSNWGFPKLEAEIRSLVEQLSERLEKEDKPPLALPAPVPAEKADQASIVTAV